MSVVADDFRKTFGNNEVPLWAPRLRSSEMSKDFSRRKIGFDNTSALGNSFSGTGGFPITFITRSVVESSGEEERKKGLLFGQRMVVIGFIEIKVGQRKI